MSYQGREDFWAGCDEKGWATLRDHATTLYPRPGERDFDDNASFEQIALFPRSQSGKPVRAGEMVWTVPLSWYREYETRPLSHLTFKFHLPHVPSQDAAARAAELCIKRCFYLTMFHARRPLGLATLKNRMKIFKAFAKQALKEGKPLSALTYADLLVAVRSLPWKDRRAVPSVYEQLRLWRAAAPATYPMFMPPPSINGVEPDCAHEGLDTENVRDDEDEPTSQSYQPFNDDFVSAAGEFCLSVLDELQPALQRCLEEVMAIPEDERLGALPSILAGRTWPLNFDVKSLSQLRGVGSLCQLSAIFVLSLVLGPRWSEVSSLPASAVGSPKLGPGGQTLWGLTFKLSQSAGGEWRDWPISERLAGYLNAQRAYSQLLEGEDFPYLWRNHRRLWGGGEPHRQIDHSLKKFAEKYGFARLTDGNVHHHRFRKTTARLIVIALHGGPIVLRRLFGHEHLGMTLRYILANASILDELREIAEEEHRRTAAAFIEKRDELVGGGAKAFSVAIEEIAASAEIFVPNGARDQARITNDEIIEVISGGPDGLSLKQILPGLVACYKPRDEPGLCCKENELPNVAKCQAECMWHLAMPHLVETARTNVNSALQHLKGKAPGSPHWVHYGNVIREKLRLFPDLMAEFGSDPLVSDLLT